MKHKATLVLAFAALLTVAVFCAVLYIAYMNFPYDSVGNKDIPSEFFVTALKIVSIFSRKATVQHMPFHMF